MGGRRQEGEGGGREGEGRREGGSDYRSYSSQNFILPVVYSGTHGIA